MTTRLRTLRWTGSWSVATVRFFSIALAFAGCRQWPGRTFTLDNKPVATAGVRKVLVIAIDGLRADALEAAEAPNIHAMIRVGCYSNQAQCEDLTFSGPNHSSILHGVHRDKHNVTSNDYKGNRLADWPDFFTYLERFDPNRNTFRFHTWNEAHNNQPTGADAAIFCDYEKDGDEEMTRQVVGLLSGMHPRYLQDPDVIFMFYSDVDESGHAHGFHPSVPAYLAEIADTDAKIGRVLDAMRERPHFMDEDWLVVLTTDHGGSADKGHSGGTPERRTIPFLVYGAGVVWGTPFPPPKNVDVARTVLGYMGVQVAREWQLDGHCVGVCACWASAPSTGLGGHGTQDTTHEQSRALGPIFATPCHDCALCGNSVTGPAIRTKDACCIENDCLCDAHPILRYTRNLIGNGDAEFDRGLTSTQYDQAISGWDDPGPDGMTVIQYNGPDGYPTSSDPGPPDRGRNFFAGGKGVESRIAQTIDVRALSKDIDARRVRFQLSGWLGGFADQSDHAELTATFLNAGGQVLGKAGLAPVRPEDRNKKTALLYREATGDLPRGTTHIRVELRCSRSGDGSNDGYADDMSLVLRRK